MNWLRKIRSDQYTIHKRILMVPGKKQRIFKRHFFKVGIKDPSEKDSESKRRDYEF
jgi:hypothetical protein